MPPSGSLCFCSRCVARSHEHVTEPGCGSGNGAHRNSEGRSRAHARESPWFNGPYLMLNLVLALLAGVVTRAAPCTLPLPPLLLGESVGQTAQIRPAPVS